MTQHKIPEVISSPHAMQAFSSQVRARHRRISFVPTMGALHEGHLSLMRAAKEQGDVLVVSIFVNPLQFGPREDFGSYPRTLERDLQLCASVGVDVVFTPSKEVLYPASFSMNLSAGSLSHLYCGASRPGFFDGVLTVVNILLQLVQPHKAFFGEKDFQQLFLVKKMVQEMYMPIEVIGCPIVREKDNLAMSSRNVYLNPQQRSDSALVLWRCICAVQKLVDRGERSVPVLSEAMQCIFKETPDFTFDYAEFIDAETFAPMPQSLSANPRLLLAGYVGTTPRTRLIDNTAIAL